MSAVVTRTDNGDTLLIDGVVGVTCDRQYLVTQFPVADTLTDHSQPIPPLWQLDCVISETPPDSAPETGPQHVDAVLAWLTEAQAKVLEVDVPDRPAIRSVMLTGTPYQYGIDRAIRLRIGLREVRKAQVETFQTDRPEPDAAAGLAGQADDGEQAPEEPEQSLADRVFEMFTTLGGGG